MSITARIAEIRKELKYAFKGYKLSVVNYHYNGVSIYVLAAPYEMTTQKSEQVNPYYIDRTYTGRTAEDLSKISRIASRGVRYYETGDYGTQPDFYVNISIGRWDRPFEVKN